MRIATGFFIAVSLCAPGAAWSQTAASQPAAAAAAPQALPAAAVASQPARAPCNNPNALGVARTVEIDTTGGPGFGFEHFKELDFLRDKEVVLTFDDGPWPVKSLKLVKDALGKAGWTEELHGFLMPDEQTKQMIESNEMIDMRVRDEDLVDASDLPR